ncbi:MAG: 1-deoxy-D-xylulose-5-phosphate synthase [Magnetococcales bacterium]|nr:1-deoxy-D-xylulose-5-phosphate synthase [Magnetococcales bacterium]
MAGLLEQITTPVQLRQLAESDLSGLADELRAFTIDTVAKTGGHLGASLGVVELTIALHYIFDTPDDRLIWDVGHQSYPHKILTGRRQQMHTLRQRHGLSGFTKRDESPYDPFGAGHSSTSISAALGMAMAMRHRQQRRKVIAVIGDGALTAGMSFEALNNAGQHEDIDLVVVLNDNEMSISRNVGAIAAYLSRILSGRFYTRLKDGTGRVLDRISPPLRQAARRAEGHVKGMLTPGTLFEELGFNYLGPIDGHDFHQLLPTLRNIKRLTGPVLLHVVTRKGKGFAPAETNPCTYHGVQPFDRQTGLITTQHDKLSFTRVFADAMVDLALDNPRLVAITAAMPEGTGLHLFQERFPQRFFDVGIAEQHAVTFAAGLACEGLIPVVAIYSTFLQRAYDQIIHDVALQRLPVIFAIDRAGLVGADGATHAGAFDLTFLRAIPDLVIMAPADENELRSMLATAVTLNRPVALRYPRGDVVGLPAEKPQLLPIGCGRCLRRGDDNDPVLLMAVGFMVHRAVAAAQVLQQQDGLSLTVYDARFVKPLDRQMVREAARKRHIITLEENSVVGGFGAAVLECLGSEQLGGHVPNQTLSVWGLPDQFVPHGTQQQLWQELQLDVAGIVARIRQLIASGRTP